MWQPVHPKRVGPTVRGLNGPHLPYGQNGSSIGAFSHNKARDVGRRLTKLDEVGVRCVSLMDDGKNRATNKPARGHEIFTVFD